jgi:ribosomal protein S18 acetylase RimI-like enzyme
MEFRIRKATLDDADSIARVHVESWQTTYAGIVPQPYLDSLSREARAQNWRQHLAAADPLILVAEGEPGVFGFACGGKQRDPTLVYDGELYAIYLLRTAQRQGIGRALARAVAEDLRSRNCRSMIVWVLKLNPAVAFYKALGGVHVAEKPIEIGGTRLIEVAFGWSSLAALAPDASGAIAASD